VGSHNEATLLRRCLPSLAFCDEVIVVDIDSDDDTAEVAAKYGARVIRHSHAPVIEPVRMEVAGDARNEWLLFVDPDEVVPDALARQVAEILPTLAHDVSVIRCPWQFYFRGKPLAGTAWGGVMGKWSFVRRGGVELRPTVHSGIRIADGHRSVEIPPNGANAIQHYWAAGYRDLLAKHWRYVKREGRDRYDQGIVTGYKDILRNPVRDFASSFFKHRGFRDGFAGFVLSLLWAAYRMGAKISLLRELRRNPRPPAAEPGLPAGVADRGE
jgi:glycosyltransferase involved in cell wall biosynthesis